MGKDFRENNDIIEKIEGIKELIEKCQNPDCRKTLEYIKNVVLEIVEKQNDEFLESIEKRKKIEDDLLLFKSATEQSASAIVITNLAGDIIYVNKKFCKITGYDCDEVLGSNPRILKSGKQSKEFYEELWETISAGKEWRGEFHNKRKDGSLYWEFATISPIKNNEGKITHYVAVKEDITAQKKVEEELKRSQILLQQEIETKNKFFSLISHDLRSPFTALLGYSEMLEEDYDELTDEEKKEYIHSLRQTATNIFELLDSLLKWARAQSNKIAFAPDEYDLFDLVVEIMVLFKNNAEKKEIELVNKVLPHTGIFCDRDMMLTMLRNLTSNALKFTPHGGKIEFDYEKTDTHHIIMVKDNGVGLDEETKKKIFDLTSSFTTLGTEEEQGSGLGLAFVVDLAKRHHGKIDVESQPGKGSEFKIYIPKNLKGILEDEKI